MAVADTVMPSPPPPPPKRVVGAPMLALARAAAYARAARPYVGSALALVLSSGSAAVVVARHVWCEGSAPLVFLEALTGAALKAGLCFIFLFFAHIGLLLCRHGLLFVAEIVCDLVLEFRESAIGKIFRASIQELNMSSRTVFLGVSCFLLIVIGRLVEMMSSPAVEGSISQGAKIGSMITDVGTLGFHDIPCFFFIRAFTPSARWEDQSDRRRSLLRQS